MNDERVRELVVDAYRNVRLNVPRSAIEHPARRPVRRAPVLVAVAAAVLTVTAGVSLVAGGGAPATVAGDGDDSPTFAPPVPSAVAPVESCVDPFPVRNGSPVVRRITLPDVGLEIYANEFDVVLCWNGPPAIVRDSAADPVFPAGQLAARSTTMVGGSESVGLTFGRTPPGTTAVEVHFADGSSLPAQVQGEWFAAAASGAGASRFNEVVRVVAQTPSGPVTYLEPPGQPAPPVEPSKPTGG